MSKVLDKIDWELLANQKELLFGMSINQRNTLDKDTLDAIDGIVNLLDNLQDEEDTNGSH